MLKIKLTQDAYVQGYEGALYRLHTDDGKPSTDVIFNNWYFANATDDYGNEYDVVWKIEDQESFENGDEDCCDWDNPTEIFSHKDNKPIDAEILW